MTNTIFDLIEEDFPEGKKGYIEAAKRAPEPKDDSFVNQVSDYGKTLLKGAVEGIGKLGRIMGPIPTPGKSESEIQREQTEALDVLLPTDEGFLQRGLRRGLQEAPTAMAFPGAAPLQTAVRTGIAGYAGETAKELGAPEWMQTAAELTAYIGPDVTKKLLEKGSNKEIIEAARKLGLSDEAITPLIQSEFKQKWLSKLTPRRGATQTALERSRSELGEAYSTIQKSERARSVLNEQGIQELTTEIDKLLFEMPANVRSKIRKDYSDLRKNPITGDTLINFWKDINSEMGAGSKQLSLLKDPIRKALKNISPELGEDFQTVNKLFTKYHPIAERLKPNLMSDIIGASEAIGLLASVTLGNYPFIISFAGEKAGKKIIQQMLINPKFQQISHKMVDALNQNKFEMAKKLTDLLAHELRKTSPEISDKLEEISIDDLKKMLTNQKKEEEQAASQE